MRCDVRPWTGFPAFTVLLLALLGLGCSDDGSSPQRDITSPAVTELSIVQVDSSSVILGWPAPGDDGTEGQATTYDLRYSPTWITPANWNSARQAATSTPPAAAGTREGCRIGELSPGTVYFFSLRTADEAGNWSEISPIVSTLTRGGNPDDVHWWDGFGSERTGLSADVLSLAEYQGSLIAGGWFQHAGGAAAHGIARWNGTTWDNIGNLDGGLGANALLVWNDRLIAAGDFTSAGGHPALSLASWNGADWSSLGAGVARSSADERVLALAVFNGDLAAAGRFPEAGGIPCGNIARWDGSAWAAFGAGLDGPVNALAVFNGELVAGGGFARSGAAFVGTVAAWDGASWHPLGQGTEGSVAALAVYEGDLIAAGSIRRSGATDTEYLLRWNGSTWTAFGGGVSMRCVLALTVYRDDLIAGGMFGYHGATWCPGPFRMISRWDGSAWRSLGSGMRAQTEDAGVAALLSLDGDLFAGGVFSTAGGKWSYSIARWQE